MITNIRVKRENGVDDEEEDNFKENKEELIMNRIRIMDLLDWGLSLR